MRARELSRCANAILMIKYSRICCRRVAMGFAVRLVALMGDEF